MSIPCTKLSLLIFFFFFLFSTHEASAQLGRKVGGRTRVKDVENNKDVQNLGRFCVQEYNLRQAANGSSGGGSKKKLLSFSRVVEAETQVVSGIKYYLRISASNANYDAVVVVKPWMRSKELVYFTPSPPRSDDHMMMYL